MKEMFNVVAKDVNNCLLDVCFDVEEKGNEIHVLIKKEELDGKKIDYIRVESELCRANEGDDGYCFYPVDFNHGVMMTYFAKKREESSFRSRTSAMPVAGISNGDKSVFIHVQKMRCDSRFFGSFENGVYSLYPEVVLDGDDPDEDILVVFTKMPGAGYMDMAKLYRKYQFDVMGARPLKERAAEREELRLAADCIELRVRMGWKPQPTPVRRQTLENEPEMKIACTVPILNKIIDKMKEEGVSGAEICLVGWGPGGHDGRFPDQYPCDERFGGDEALRDFIKRAQSYGYLVVCHTNSKGAYEIASSYDEKTLTVRRDKDGVARIWLREDYAKNGLQGGDPWHVCAKPAYEKYAVKDLPVVRDYGFRGLHYVDELTACEPVKCCSPDHPITRAQTVEYYKKIANLSTELFGGFQSEAWFDFINADTDYVLYTSVHSFVKEGMNPMYDDVLPFFALTYHGIVMANATSGTVNYPIKDINEQLRMVEYGSRPMLYINSKFAGRDWMGKNDLYCSNDEEIAETVKAIKRAADDYDRMKRLQYEYIENHERLADGVVRVTYSDGSVVTVDYEHGEYTFVDAEGNNA